MDLRVSVAFFLLALLALGVLGVALYSAIFLPGGVEQLLLRWRAAGWFPRLKILEPPALFLRGLKSATTNKSE